MKEIKQELEDDTTKALKLCILFVLMLVGAAVILGFVGWTG